MIPMWNNDHFRRPSVNAMVSGAVLPAMKWLDGTVQDLRFTLRGWAKTPGFSIAAVATLALGIGANTAVFSMVSGVLLRPLPYDDPDRLVQVNEIQPRSASSVETNGPVWPADFLEFRSHSRLFEGFITYQVSSANLLGMGDPEQLTIVPAERGLFPLLGAAPLAGRTIAPNDPPNVTVVSRAFSLAHFGAASAAVGRTLNLDGQTLTIIGVMPAEFQFPYRGSGIDLWIPWEIPPVRRGRFDGVVARLRPAVGFDAARQELNAMATPSTAGRRVMLRSLKEVVTGPARNSLLVLLGAVGMVLLVACVNVANLLLARTAARDREIAIRVALGAGRMRIVRQFLTESLLLAAAGALAGLALGQWGSRALVRAAARQLPRAGEIGLDWRVFVFLLAVCVVAAVGFGLAPALAAARGGSSALKTRSSGTIVRDGLVVTEIALAFVLLAGAGLLIRTFLNLQRADAGVRSENVLTVHMLLTGGPEAVAIQDRVARIPGVRAAGFISMLPLDASGWTAGFHIPGREEILPCELRYVTPGYFTAMGVPIRRGRDFTPFDAAGQPGVILVNQALARAYFGDRDPVGVKIDRGLIVGVVADVRQARLSEPATPIVFSTMIQNFAQMRSIGSTLVVSGQVPVENLTAAIRAAIREINPAQALFQVSTMKRVVENSLANQRLYAWLLGLFAATGALLAVAGIYGVIAYLVALRTREFGIRMALGADSARVLALVMYRGAVVVALGLAFGMAGAAALTRVLRTLLYGVGIIDPATFGSTAVLLAAVALFACLIPAIRAARVDPAIALRE
jgi:putative ABC transport system permease protein